MRRLAAVVFSMAIIAAVTALVAPAVTAASAFPVLKELGPSLEPYAALPADAQARLAAGLVTEPVFAVTDYVTPLCLLLALAALVAARRTRLPWVVAAAGIGSLAQLFYFAPRLAVALDSYRRLAREGLVEQAMGYRVAFDSVHTPAMATHMATLLLVLTAAALAAWSQPFGRERS